jgi:mannose-6-phosphate isomerase-like protein (cupin superfamily)
MQKSVRLMKPVSLSSNELPGGLKYKLVATGSKFTTGIAVAEPGTGESWHKHTDEVEETYYIVKGQGRIAWKSDGDVHTLEFSSGDALYLPFGLENELVNTGKDELTIIFTITNATKSRE